jgi:ergothioneine biosynthesis protein EgtB
VRATTERLGSYLTAEDQNVQSMPDASPVKWHRAHTTWFFETFVLERFERNFRPFHPGFRALFNSYYESVGDRHARPLRGVLSRPTSDEITRWRRETDLRVLRVLEAPAEDIAALVTVGIHHEQQHQELILTDIKHAFSQNELKPTFAERPADTTGAVAALQRLEVPEGLYEVGHEGAGFGFDNERPRHRVYLRSARIGHRPVTNSEWLEFVNDGGYQTAAHWLSDGWAIVQREGWRAPLYWEQREGEWWTFTLAGMRPVQSDEPVCHVSYYEADAYARWAGARLPSEAEWEVASITDDGGGTSLSAWRFHPTPTGDSPRFLGDVWEWTSSAYEPYPGYKPWPGALAEYNGKFMSGQMVLRGGSCVTPDGHARRTYRNFFPPAARWQFSGLRLARDR